MGTTFKRIGTYTVSGTSTNTITFSDIPQTYSDLYVTVTGRNTRTTAMYGYLYLNFNAESARTLTNYWFRRLTWNNDNAGQSYDSSMVLGWGLTTDWQTSNVFGTTNIRVMDYASTTRNKSLQIYDGNSTNGTATESSHSGWAGGHWANTAAITSLSLSTAADQMFSPNSTVYIYGIE